MPPVSIPLPSDSGPSGASCRSHGVDASPPSIEPRAVHTCGATSSRTIRTEPSAAVATTAPGWRLRAAKSRAGQPPGPGTWSGEPGLRRAERWGAVAAVAVGAGPVRRLPVGVLHARLGPPHAAAVASDHLREHDRPRGPVRDARERARNSREVEHRPSRSGPQRIGREDGGVVGRALPAVHLVVRQALRARLGLDGEAVGAEAADVVALRVVDTLVERRGDEHVRVGGATVDGDRLTEGAVRFERAGFGAPGARADHGGDVGVAEPGEEREGPEVAAGERSATAGLVAEAHARGETVVRLVPGEDRLADAALVPHAGVPPARLA